MQSKKEVDELMDRSRACLDASRDRILRSAKSVRDSFRVIESALTRVDQSERLLSEGNESILPTSLTYSNVNGQD